MFLIFAGTLTVQTKTHLARAQKGIDEVARIKT